MKFKLKLLIAVACVARFATYFLRKDFATVLAGMVEAGFVNKTIGGLVGTALFIGYGVGQVVFGLLSDRVNPKLLLTLGFVFCIGCNVCTPWMPDPRWLVFVWLVNGLSQALLYPPIVRLLADNLNEEDFVKGNMIFSVAGHFATIVLFFYAPFCLQYFDWQFVFYSAGALGALALVLTLVGLFFCVPRKKADRPVSERSDEPNAPGGSSEVPAAPNVISGKEYVKLFVSTGLIPAFLCIICNGFLRDGLDAWIPVIYAENFGVGAATAILVSVLAPVAAAISNFLAGVIHKKPLFYNECTGTFVLCAAASVLCVPLFFLVGKTHSVVLGVITVIVMSLITGSQHCANFLIISALPGKYAKFGRAASLSAILNSATYVGAAISSYGIGKIADTWGWTPTLFLYLAFAILATVFIAFAIPPFTRFIKSSKE